MTMADVREANKHAGGYFFNTNKRGHFLGARESFRGPYTGPGGTFILAHQVDGERERFTVYQVKDSGHIGLPLYVDGPIGLAVELAKVQATERPPTLTGVLRGLGVHDASVVAKAWLQATQAKIIEDMRSLAMPITVRDWAEMLDVTDADRYMLTADGMYPSAVEAAVRRYPHALNYARDALMLEVNDWLQALGHVKALKRLGKRAFRANPRRHRRNPASRRCTH